MVPDLVRHDIGLGEVTRGIVTPLEVVEKTQVEIDLLVTRAIERPHRGLPHAARRIDCTAKQHQPWLFVVLPFGLEDVVPGLFGIGQHHGHELDQLFFLFRLLDLARRCRVSGLHRAAFEPAEQPAESATAEIAVSTKRQYREYGALHTQKAQQHRQQLRQTPAASPAQATETTETTEPARR